MLLRLLVICATLQVLTFCIWAQTGLTPSLCRTSLGRYCSSFPSLSQNWPAILVLMSSVGVSTRRQWFAFARLSSPYLTALMPPFPQRSPPWLFTNAACGGLRSLLPQLISKGLPSSLMQPAFYWRHLLFAFVTHRAPPLLYCALH